mmetsp:Transcript_62867/g.187051  ORF Transcript_62867/g.187051 Transcript_62867/m.187051 type:complete len:233 (+) Transcript_62867:253-951(+)
MHKDLHSHQDGLTHFAYARTCTCHSRSRSWRAPTRRAPPGAPLCAHAAAGFHQMRPLSPASLKVRSSFCHGSAPSARSIADAPPRFSLALNSLHTACGLAPRRPLAHSRSQKRSEKLMPERANFSARSRRTGSPTLSAAIVSATRCLYSWSESYSGDAASVPHASGSVVPVTCTASARAATPPPPTNEKRSRTKRVRDTQTHAMRMSSKPARGIAELVRSPARDSTTLHSLV